MWILADGAGRSHVHHASVHGDGTPTSTRGEPEPAEPGVDLRPEPGPDLLIRGHHQDSGPLDLIQDGSAVTLLHWLIELFTLF